MSPAEPIETIAPGYTIRRFQPDDAAGVTDCVRKVYGSTYLVHPELYHPEQVARLNERGQLISLVALAPDGSVGGHYAVERPDLGPVGETGEAIVLPEHRHHHLLERMRAHLIDQARRLGMFGLFGQPVTNHVFSQKMYEHYEGFPCGVSLGIDPMSFHNLPEPLTQRLTCLLYFQYLKKPESVRLHVPEQHRPMVERIYAQFEVTVEALAEKPPEGAGEVTVQYEAELQFGEIKVGRVGNDSAQAIRDIRSELCERSKAEMLLVNLPLAQPATPWLCRELESAGFFFCGLGPHFAADGDVLRLQYLNADLDPSILKIFNPFAQELVDYAVREWRAKKKGNRS